MLQKQKKHFQKEKKYVIIGENGLLKNEFSNAFAPFDFSRHSTIGCGGVAKGAFYPQTVTQLKDLLTALQKAGLRYHILGNLSNVLPPDGASARYVIRTTELLPLEENNERFVSAGMRSGVFMRRLEKLGLSGGEFLAGIPCTIGGALYMNAGVSGRYIAELVESVTVLRAGHIEKLSLDECRFAYKQSVFMQNNWVILGAHLRLAESSSECVAENIREYVQKRAHLPKGKSMGCVFKNPPNALAGKLIEGAGLKGLRIGGASVSTEHANFILNDNGALSAEIKSLIGLVKNAVYAQYRVRLEEEIRYLD